LLDIEGNPVQFAFLNLPLSKKNDGIADHWKKRFVTDPALLDASDDTSEFTTKVQGESKGDGFTVLEKYRGFVIRGKHRRLDPRVKDAFIYDSSGIYSHTYKRAPASAFKKAKPKKSIGRHFQWNTILADLIKIRFHFIEPDEMGPKVAGRAGKVNFNGDNDQFAIRLIRRDTLNGSGETDPLVNGSLGSPLMINIRKIRETSDATAAPVGTLV